MPKIHIYTDGACSGNPGPGGWAAVILYKDTVIELADRFKMTTNNIMEMLAVLNGLKYVSKNFSFENEVVVYTDSAYLYNCWKADWWKKWEFNGWLTSKKEPVKNKEIWEQLIPYFKLSAFSMVKVKGHSGNEYNEIADQLATGARLPKG